MGKIARYLNQLTTGDVFDAPEVLEAYSTDRSVLKIRPKLVALPESTDDVRKLMRFSSQLLSKGIKLPVTVRGSGLDEMGADLGNGLIISTEKLNRLLESDKRERLVRVQAGITLRELNTALSVNGLTIPVEGHDNETIGGLISNGELANFVERMEVVLPSGDILQTARISRRTAAKRAREKTNEGRIYSKMLQTLKKNEALIKVLKNNVPSLAGYHNVVKILHKSSLDFLPLFFGAEGTLGVITEVILRTAPIQKDVKCVAATFKDYAGAEKFLELAKSLKPMVLDIYDFGAIKIAEESGKKPNDITKKMNKGLVVLVKFDGKSSAKIRKLAHFDKKMPRGGKLTIESNKTAAALKELESALMSFVSYTKIKDATPLMVGFSIPEKSLVNFAHDLKFLEDKLKLDLVLYGSYKENNYSLSPKFDMKNEDSRKKAISFLRASAYIIKRQGGVIASGVPEGRVKALVINDELTEAEKNLYVSIKNAFDRQGILNPGVKTDQDVRFTIRHFRSL